MWVFNLHIGQRTVLSLQVWDLGLTPMLWGLCGKLYYLVNHLKVENLTSLQSDENTFTYCICCSDSFVFCRFCRWQFTNRKFCRRAGIETTEPVRQLYRCSKAVIGIASRVVLNTLRADWICMLWPQREWGLLRDGLQDVRKVGCLAWAQGFRDLCLERIGDQVNTIGKQNKTNKKPHRFFSARWNSLDLLM